MRFLLLKRGNLLLYSEGVQAHSEYKVNTKANTFAAGYENFCYTKKSSSLAPMEKVNRFLKSSLVRGLKRLNHKKNWIKYLSILELL